MQVGVGYQATPLTPPILSSSTAVTTVDEAFHWVTSTNPSAEVTPLAQVQAELSTQGWSRIAHSTLEEYFLVR